MFDWCVAGEIDYGGIFLFEEETFMRIRPVGVGQVVSIDKNLEAHHILAVSMKKHDLIVIDRFADVQWKDSDHV